MVVAETGIFRRRLPHRKIVRFVQIPQLPQPSLVGYLIEQIPKVNPQLNFGVYDTTMLIFEIYVIIQCDKKSIFS